LKLSYTIMAVGFAPLAEEYLFRGLLYRALDREWGGWRAVLASSAFFAMYHQPLARLPVGLLGATQRDHVQEKTDASSPLSFCT
jgi:membrane protease YdiL (CAAX protease family)